jgi:hypothetical protein
MWFRVRFRFKGEKDKENFYVILKRLQQIATVKRDSFESTPTFIRFLGSEKKERNTIFKHPCVLVLRKKKGFWKKIGNCKRFKTTLLFKLMGFTEKQI